MRTIPQSAKDLGFGLAATLSNRSSSSPFPHGKGFVVRIAKLRLWYILFALCLFSGMLSAETICKGIVLLGAEELFVPEDKLRLFKGTLICMQEEDTALAEYLALKLKRDFIGSKIDSEMTERLRKSIKSFYRKEHHPMTEVVIPPQEIFYGVIQVRIKESKVATIQVEGNKHTSEDLLIDYLGVHKNEPIDTQQLRKNLDFMNRNPFRRVDLLYGAGEEPQTTDISLLVEDRRPVRIYAGTDNTGVETTDRGRFLAGINCAKLFALDHFITYQYTASYDFHRFQAHTLQYIAYLPWRNVWNMYGGYSSMYADLPFPGSRNHGQSYQASGRYTVPLTPTTRVVHELTFGFDFKRTNNTIEFSEVFPTVGPNVNLSQFMIGYAGSLAKDEYRLDFDGEVYFSPGAMLGDETNAAYSALRPGAKNQWVYGKALLKYFQKLPHACYLNLTARGQISSQNLLPSEQVGLGGFETVRGYDERQLNFDSGCILNAEFLTPTVSIFQSWKKRKNWKDALQFLGFLDYGYGGNHTPIPGEKKRDHLLGIGPGVRYTVDPWLTARLDLGIKLRRESGFTGGSAMWYFSFIASL